MATRMSIINKGKLVVQGSVKELLDSSEQYVEIRAIPEDRAEKIIKSFSFVDKTEKRNGGILVYTKTENAPLINEELVKNGVSVSAIIPRRSLEDYFLEMTEGSSDV